jgi:Ser/Thr protein kinase RdoA (MazF antagonist)
VNDSSPLDILRLVSPHFQVPGPPLEVTSLGSGHIHATYLATYQGPGGPQRIVHQRINDAVFPDVAAVMENIVRVTEHLQKKILERGGDPTREALQIVPTKKGASFHQAEDESYWRAYVMIPDCVCHDQAPDLDTLARACGAFGRFQRDLTDLPGGPLKVTIPGFHDTPARFRRFHQVLKTACPSFLTTCQAEIDFLLERESDLCVVQEALDRGELPLRTCHGDTKLNNVLFDQTSGKTLCVLDLDTVMPGSPLHDFGDAVRYGASTASEEETDLAQVTLDLDRYRAMLTAFLKETRDTLLQREVELLPFSCRLLGLELGMRFLTDHLEGDRYFRTCRKGHNLDRCRNQFALVTSMERQREEMDSAFQEIRRM